MIAATPFFSDRGCHIRIYNEIKYLQKNRHEVTLCTYHNGNDIEGIKVARSLNVPWYKKTTPGASWHKIYIDLFLLFTTIRAYLRLRPSIIHAHLYEGLLIGWIVKIVTFSKAKLIFDCQGSLAEEMMAYTLHKNRLFKPFYQPFKIFEGLLLKLPDEILFSSANSYEFIKGNYKVSASKLHVLEDAVDIDLFNRVEENNVSRTALGLDGGDVVLVYSGSLSKAKGVHELLNAMPNIFEKRDDFKLMLIGYGDLEEEIRERFESYIKEGKILLMGRVSYFDLPKYLRLADCAIEPKKDSSESSGKLYNYAAAGIPVACFNNELNKTVLGDSGFYIKQFSDLTGFVKYQKNRSKYTGRTWQVNIANLIKIYD